MPRRSQSRQLTCSRNSPSSNCCRTPLDTRQLPPGQPPPTFRGPIAASVPPPQRKWPARRVAANLLCGATRSAARPRRRRASDTQILIDVRQLVDLPAVHTQSARRPQSAANRHRQHAMVIAQVFSGTKGFSPLERYSPDPPGKSFRAPEAGRRFDSWRAPVEMSVAVRPRLSNRATLATEVASTDDASHRRIVGHRRPQRTSVLPVNPERRRRSLGGVEDERITHDIGAQTATANRRNIPPRARRPAARRTTARRAAPTDRPERRDSRGRSRRRRRDRNPPCTQVRPPRQGDRRHPRCSTFTGLTRNHTTKPVQYPQNPPVGGDHSAQYLTCGVYTSPVPNENGVHDLEHGAVWITYRCCSCKGRK